MSYWRVVYKQLIYEKTTANINPNGAAAMFFENLGTADAIINTCIPLNANDTPREFNNLPNEKIQSPFTLAFGATGTKKVLVIWKFAEQITEPNFKSIK